MRNFLQILFFFLSQLNPLLTKAQVAGDYRSAASGAWNTSSTWEIYNGSAWAALGTVSTDNNNLNSDPGWTNVVVTAGSANWQWGSAFGKDGTSGGVSYTNPISTASDGTWYYKSITLAVGVTYSLTFDYKTTNVTSSNSRIIFAISPNLPTASITWAGATVLYTALQATSNAWVNNAGTATFTPTSTGTYYFGFRSGYASAAAAITTSIDNIVLTGTAGIPSSTSGNINIKNGHTVDVNNNITIDQTTIDAGGILDSKANTINLNDGAGTDLVINGTYRRSGINPISIDPFASIEVGNGGVYEHNYTGGSVPNATWNTGSLLRIKQTVNSNLNQEFWNVTQVDADATSLTYLDNSSRTMTVNNDFRLEGGTFYLKNGGASPWGGTHTLRVKGNFIQTGGSFSWNVNNSDNASVTDIHVEKNMIISGSSVWGGYVSATKCASGVFFDGSNVDQVFSTVLTHDATGVVRDRFYYKTPDGPRSVSEIYNGTAAQFTVNGSCGALFPPIGYERWPTSGTLLKTFTINNPAGVTLRDSRNIKDTLYRTIGSITAEAASDIISYSTDATLEYNGTTAIATESMEFPTANGPTNLNINNPGSVSLHASRSLNGKLLFSKDNGLLNTSDCNATTTGSAILTLNDNATVTDENGNPLTSESGKKRFVNGIMTKIGKDAFTFPIGQLQGTTYKYAPVQISKPTNVSDSYSACYIGSNPGSVLPSPGYDPVSRDNTLNNPSTTPVTDYKVSTCEYWHFNKAGASTDVKLTLSWAYGRSCSFKNTDSLVVTNWLTSTTPDQWTNRYNDGNNTPGPGPTQTFGWVTSKDPITNYGTFTLASPTMANATLFNGQVILAGSAVKNKHILTCKLQDCNGAMLDIEYSFDGKRFNHLRRLQVNEFDIQRGVIHYTRDVLTNAPSFYRIKVNKSGIGYFYTNTVRIALEETLASLSLFPNPFTNTLQFSGNMDDVSTFRIQNAMGQTILIKQALTSNHLVLETSAWPKGIYYISVLYKDGRTESLKVVK